MSYLSKGVISKHLTLEHRIHPSFKETVINPLVINICIYIYKDALHQVCHFIWKNLELQNIGKSTLFFIYFFKIKNA